MAYQATTLKILIASPSDVGAERDEIEQAIFQWNTTYSEKMSVVLLPVRWESAVIPAMSENGDPQEIINEQIVNSCDLLIGVFWTKLGTPTKNAESGTLEEIEQFYRKNKFEEVMIYFKEANLPQTTDFDEFMKVKEYKSAFNGIYSIYSVDKVKEHLYKKIELYTNKEENDEINHKEDVSENVFLNLLDNNLLEEREILFLCYVLSTCNREYGFSWKEEETVKKIIKWEDDNKLESVLSENYKQVIVNMAERGILIEKEQTQYGNPKLFAMEINTLDSLKTLPKIYKKRIYNTANGYKYASHSV